MTTFSTDPALYIFTSLTAGSSHIVTATSRLETILRANRVPFKAVDLATDQKARMLWGRRAGKDESGRVRKLPGLVQEGLILGDLVEIEDWNEYGELKQHVKIYYDEHTIPNIHNKSPDPPKKKKATKKSATAATAASAATASASASASTSEPTSASSAPEPPAPPPMPTPGTSKRIPESSTETAKEAAGPSGSTSSAARETALPMRSVADEAAKKAKELRLRSLREKVHGKKDEASQKSEAKGQDSTNSRATAADAKDADASTAVSQTNRGDGPALDLQSPTSGKWKQGASDETEMQSPTSTKWNRKDLSGSHSVVPTEAAPVASEEKDAKKAEPEPKPSEIASQKDREPTETRTAPKSEPAGENKSTDAKRGELPEEDPKPDDPKIETDAKPKMKAVEDDKDDDDDSDEDEEEEEEEEDDEDDDSDEDEEEEEDDDDDDDDDSDDEEEDDDESDDDDDRVPAKTTKSTAA